nr:helix-turn-helix domain-containing protein [Marinilactibacillus kalidii]
MNEVGEKLKEARKAKGYTLEDLQQMTKIQKRYLIAVEEGNLEVLPGNFYARAFIKQYADTVGLDGEQLLKDHADIAAPKSEEITEQVRTTQTRTKPKENGMISTIQDSLPTILIIVFVVAIALAFYFAVRGTSGSNESPSVQDDPASKVEVDSSEDAEPSDDNQSEEPAADTENEEEADSEDDVVEEEPALSITQESSDGRTTTYAVTGAEAGQSLVLTAEDGESWVSITVDGNTVEQQLLTSGNSASAELTEDTETIKAVIGNAAATKVEFNGQTVEYAEESANAVRQDMIFEFKK